MHKPDLEEVFSMQHYMHYALHVDPTIVSGAKYNSLAVYVHSIGYF